MSDSPSVIVLSFLNQRIYEVARLVKNDFINTATTEIPDLTGYSVTAMISGVITYNKSDYAILLKRTT